MNMKLVIVGVLGLAFGLGMATAPSQANMVDDCVQEQDAALGISACSEVIASGQYQGADLAWAYLNRANAHHRAGDYEASILDDTTAIELDPALIQAYVGRGFSYYKLGNYVAALSDLDFAVSADEGYGLAYENRGLVRCKLNQTEGAYGDLRRSIRIGSWTAGQAQGWLKRQRLYNGSAMDVKRPCTHNHHRNVHWIHSVHVVAE